MKLFLTNQNLNKHLEYFKTKTVMNYDKKQLTEKVTIQEIETRKNINEIDLEFFFNYEIFPKNIMSFRTQWNDENRKMEIGDSIAQQTNIPPILNFSQKIIFGVRINEIIDDANRKGFSYETLDGHVEKGISIFTIEEVNHKVIFKIHTFSKPGNILSKLVGPIISIPYQTYCTKKAMKNVTEKIKNQ